MKDKSGTHEEYERLGVYLKLAGRLIKGLLIECLMTLNIGGAFDGDGQICPPLSHSLPMNEIPAGGSVPMESKTISEPLFIFPGVPMNYPDHSTLSF